LAPIVILDLIFLHTWIYSIDQSCTGLIPHKNVFSSSTNRYKLFIYPDFNRLSNRLRTFSSILWDNRLFFRNIVLHSLQTEWHRCCRWHFAAERRAKQLRTTSENNKTSPVHTPVTARQLSHYCRPPLKPNRISLVHRPVTTQQLSSNSRTMLVFPSRILQPLRSNFGTRGKEQQSWACKRFATVAKISFQCLFSKWNLKLRNLI